MTRERMNVVLAEPSALADLQRTAAARGGGRAGPAGISSTRRATQEEIQRVADELRDVLSLRARRGK